MVQIDKLCVFMRHTLYNESPCSPQVSWMCHLKMPITAVVYCTAFCKLLFYYLQWFVILTLHIRYSTSI